MSPMPRCACGRAFATVELDGPKRVLVCAKCAATLELVARFLGTPTKRRPVLGIVAE